MNTKVVPVEILPCPFCGVTPDNETWHGGKPTKHMVSCINDECSCAPQCTGQTHAEAIARWNVRTASPTPQERKIGQRRVKAPDEAFRWASGRVGNPDRRAAAPNAAGRENEVGTVRSEIDSASPAPAAPETAPSKESKLPFRESPEQFGDRVDWYRGKPESKLALDTARLLVMQAWARQDDWDRYFVGSDIRLLIGQALAAIDLERENAELERELTTYQNAEMPEANHAEMVKHMREESFDCPLCAQTAEYIEALAKHCARLTCELAAYQNAEMSEEPERQFGNTCAHSVRYVHELDYNALAKRCAKLTVENERLTSEAKAFQMNYRLKCDEETKRLTVELDAARTDAELAAFIDLLEVFMVDGQPRFAVYGYPGMPELYGTARMAIDAALAAQEKRV